MSTMVGVLCARVRMEEKWLIEALAVAGAPARQLPPTLAPLPVGPMPASPFATTVAGGVADVVTGIVIDRCADRVLAGVIGPTLRAMGATVIDAGLAATGDRLAIATLLANAGIARPETLLVTSEDAGMEALRSLGYPSTLLPLQSGAREIPLFDRDIAEAVLEHREVLGSRPHTLTLVQAGAQCGRQRLELLVVNGQVVATSDMGGNAEGMSIAIGLAERTAAFLNAATLGVTVVRTLHGPVVWDVQAVPEFRSLTAIGAAPAVTSMVDLILPFLTETAGHRPLDLAPGAAFRREAAGGALLSA